MNLQQRGNCFGNTRWRGGSKPWRKFLIEIAALRDVCTNLNVTVCRKSAPDQAFDQQQQWRDRFLPALKGAIGDPKARSGSWESLSWRSAILIQNLWPPSSIRSLSHLNNADDWSFPTIWSGLRHDSSFWISAARVYDPTISRSVTDHSASAIRFTNRHSDLLESRFNGWLQETAHSSVIHDEGFRKFQ